MSAATCPHCHDQVTVPAGIDPQATVRCPLCQEEFQLSRVLEALPPQLIVVGGDDSAWEGQLGEERPAFLTPATGTEESAEDEFRLADEEGSGAAAEGSEQFRFGEEAGETAASGKGAKRITPVRGKGSKPKKNPVMEVVKIAVGGVAGLAIGYVLLWWILTGLGRRPQDPIGVAPAISRFVPWIVPAPLRGPSGPDNGSGEADGFSDAAADSRWTGEDPPAPSVRPAPSRRGRGGPGQPGSGLQPANPGGSDLSSKSPEAAADSSDGGLGGERNGAGAIPPGTPELASSGLAGDEQDPLMAGVEVPEIELPGPATDFGPATDSGSPAPGAAPPSGTTQGLVVADALEISASQLQRRMREAREQEQAWEAAEDPATTRPEVAWYVAIGALGEAVTFADAADPEIRSTLEQAGQWLTDLAAAPTKVDALGPLGSKWLGSENRSNRGILLAGTVRSVTSQDGYFEIRLAPDAPGNGDPVSVLLLNDPGSLAKPGTRLLVLGAISKGPELQGYQGSEERVVLGGRFSRIP